MSTFTFKGFSIGSSVAISAVQGAKSAANSVSTWGQASLGSLDILTTTAPVATAPAPVWVEAIEIAGFDVAGGPGAGEIYDPSFHEITFIWTVRNAPLAPFSAPGNMVSTWNDPNVAYGKRVAFAFPDPGTYTIDLWAIDSSGTTASASTTINVIDPDSVYPGSRTICFSNDPGETWAGEKSGCQRITTLASLHSALESAQTPTRVLFKCGQTIPEVDMRLNDGHCTHVGKWGTGEKPIIRPLSTIEASSFRFKNDDTQITVENIHFLGYWDSTNEVGFSGGSPMRWNSMSVDFTAMVYGCEIDGYESNDASCDINITMHYMFANSTNTNWRQFGLFCQKNQTGKIALIGSCLAHHPEALNGGPKHSIGNDHGPIRIADCGEVYFGVTDFFSSAGWSGSKHDTQPCIRVNSNNLLGASYVMDRIVCENGYQIINMEGFTDTAADRPGNYLLDRALLIGTARTRQFVSCHLGGSTFRNVLGILPNAPDYSNTLVFFRFEITNDQDNNSTVPVALYNSTMVTLRDGANEFDRTEFSEEIGAVPFVDLTQENNIFYAPNSAIPHVAAGPLDLSTPIPGVTPRYKGLRFGYKAHEGVMQGDLAHGASLPTIPYSAITRQDEIGNGSAAATTQSYWQTAEAAGDALHMLSIQNGGNGRFFAHRGDFSVDFQAGGIVITNQSGTTWKGTRNDDVTPADFDLRLDRKSHLDTDLPLATQYANPATLPLCALLAGSPAIGGATLGLKSYADFNGLVRALPASQGAVEP